MEVTKYCYSCDKLTTFIDYHKWDKKSPTKLHCSICGVYAWYNDCELKIKYEKKKVDEQLKKYFPQ